MTNNDVDYVRVSQATREMGRGATKAGTRDRLRTEKNALVNRKIQIESRLSVLNSRSSPRSVDHQRIVDEQNELKREKATIETDLRSLNDELKPLEREIGGTPIVEQNEEIIKRIDRMERKLDAIVSALQNSH